MILAQAEPFTELINPTWWQIGAMALLLVVVALFTRRLGLGLERTLLIGIVRTIVQLTLLGLVLQAVFASEQWWAVVLILGVIVSVASWEVTRRQRVRLPGQSLFAAAGLALGAGGVLLVLTQLVLRIEPWFNPYYLIPFGGMMLGNAMTTIALAFDRFGGELRTRREEIETALALGADAPSAAHLARLATLRAATLPLILQLSTVGIVQIPGAMTGQILGGVAPTIAVKYQILVMFAWCASAFFAVLLATRLALRHYFTADLAIDPRVLGAE